MRYCRVATLKTPDEFRAYLSELGVKLPVDDEVQLPGLRVFVPEGVHFRELVARVDVQHREGQLPEERFSAHLQKSRGILTHRPEHRQLPEFVVRFPDDVDAFVFERV